MCFAYAYRLQVLGMIQTDVVAISDRNLAKTLQEGANGDKEPDAVMLEKFQAGDTVYQRGSNLYLGDKKERVQSDYPFYTGDGTGIWYFQATGSLITDDFMEYEPYAGLYVSDGTAFDEDGVGQDEDTYIFAKLNNGLYMNTVPVTIRSNGVDHALRLGSLISFQEDAVSSYSYAGDRLVYAGLAHLLDAKVVIRDKTYDYDSFLKQLGVLHDPTQPVVKADEPEETIAAESGSSEEAQRRNGSRQADISEIWRHSWRIHRKVPLTVNWDTWMKTWAMVWAILYPVIVRVRWGIPRSAGIVSAAEAEAETRAVPVQETALAAAAEAAEAIPEILEAETVPARKMVETLDMIMEITRAETALQVEVEAAAEATTMQRMEVEPEQIWETAAAITAIPTAITIMAVMEAVIQQAEAAVETAAEACLVMSASR